MYIACFAAQFCHHKSLVFCVEGHHQTCLPLQESLTAHCVVTTKCMPVVEGMLLDFLISIAQEHLPWPIFHVTWSPSFLWARHDTSQPSQWPTLSCLNWFTMVNVSITQACVEYWSYQFNVNVLYHWFTRHDLMMNSSFSLSSSIKQSSRYVHGQKTWDRVSQANPLPHFDVPSYSIHVDRGAHIQFHNAALTRQLILATSHATDSLGVLHSPWQKVTAFFYTTW